MQLNYQFMKKCVSEGPVSPMPYEWWNEILSMIPQDLINSPDMQPYIKDLYDELMKEYDKSMRKAMGMYCNPFGPFSTNGCWFCFCIQITMSNSESEIKPHLECWLAGGLPLSIQE